MNGKAIIGLVTDAPDLENLRYSFRVTFLSSQGFVASENIDVFFLASDTLAQIKQKIRVKFIERGAEIGLNISLSDVGSISQI